MIHRTGKRMTLCVTLLIGCLAFIWGNSLLPASASSALSQWFWSLLGPVMPGLDHMSQGHGTLRKLAHFTEFCALGLLLSWLFAMLKTKKWAFALPALGCGCLTACVDELLQHLSPGRSPGIGDVAIDSAGVILGIILLAAGYTIKTKKHHIHNGGNQQ